MRSSNRGGFDGVRMDIPDAHGHPPPPRSGGATSSDEPSRAKAAPLRRLLLLLGIVIVSTLGILIIILDWKNHFPRFKIESVSVSVSVHVPGNSSNGTHDAAIWDLGFSIDRAVFGDLDVWVRFMSRDFKAESVGSAGTASVSVSTVLPPAAGLDFRGGLTLEHVVFKFRFRGYGVQAACKDVAVDGIVSSKGVMKGGPRSCPLAGYERIY